MWSSSWASRGLKSTCGNARLLAAGSMPREKETAMDESSIKAASKQFDLSCVFKLSMTRMGIRRIANLHLVPSLTVCVLQPVLTDSHGRLTKCCHPHALRSWIFRRIASSASKDSRVSSRSNALCS